MALYLSILAVLRVIAYVVDYHSNLWKRPRVAGQVVGTRVKYETDHTAYGHQTPDGVLPHAHERHRR